MEIFGESCSKKVNSASTIDLDYAGFVVKLSQITQDNEKKKG